SGTTTVNQGTLVTTTASTGGGGYSVSDGATLNVQVAGAGGQMNIGNLNLGSGSSGTLVVDTKTFGNPSVAPVNAGGSLSVNGSVNIQLAGSALAPGTFPLISYAGGESIVGSLNLVTAPRVVATLSDDHVGTISVTITAIDPSV